MAALHRILHSILCFLGLRASAHPDDAAGDQQHVQEQLLQMIAKQGARVPYPVLACALLIGGMAGRGGQWLMPVLWTAVTVMVVLFRVWVIARLPRMVSVPVAQRIQWAALQSLLVGVAFSASLLFEARLDAHERMVQTIVLLGLSAGAVASTFGHPRIYLMYLVPVTAANALSWLWVAHGGGFLNLSTVVGGLILIYGAILAGLARDNYRVLAESVLIRRQQIASNEQLRVALNRAEAAMQAKTRFLASASHDLRQPLHSLSLLGEALRRRALPESERQLAERISQAVGSLSLQMDALLDISKLDAEVVPVHERVFCLKSWLQRVSQELALSAAHKQLSFELHVPDVAFVRTDPLLLERVVRNLIDNAIKYTAQGAVSVLVFPGDEEEWLLAVRDTGIGIAQAEQTRIFDEFYQIGNPERDRRKGLGLGLSIVSRLVDLLDIPLTLESDTGQGSVFTLHLPAAEPIDMGDAGGEPGEAALPPLPPLHVLVVDDEEDIRFALQELLTGMGCQVSLAAGTREAMIRCLSRQPDLALVDYRLKGGDDGLATVRSLRSAVPGLPAVLVSGDTDPKRLRDAHAAGLNLVHKPLSAARLIEAMHRALHDDQASG